MTMIINVVSVSFYISKKEPSYIIPNDWDLNGDVNYLYFSFVEWICFNFKNTILLT